MLLIDNFFINKMIYCCISSRRGFWISERIRKNRRSYFFNGLLVVWLFKSNLWCFNIINRECNEIGGFWLNIKDGVSEGFFIVEIGDGKWIRVKML